MEKDFSGLDARFWNRIFHAALEERGRYRTLAVVEGIVITVLIIMLIL